MKKLVWGLGSILGVLVLSACGGGTEPLPSQATWLESEQQCVSQGVTISFTGVSAQEGCATLAREASPALQSIPSEALMSGLQKLCCGQTCDCNPQSCSCGPITCTEC